MQSSHCYTDNLNQSLQQLVNVASAPIYKVIASSMHWAIAGETCQSCVQSLPALSANNEILDV